jgi:nucleoside-diphosphate-sugar epimerase
VTGGAGFLGSHVCERLLDLGLDVLCLDNFLTGSPANIEHLLAHDGFAMIRTDVSAPVVVPERLDYVLHLASPASPLDYARFPVETLEAGSLGTLNMLRLAEANGARFLLASTSEAYGDPQQHPQREDYWGHVNPVGPRSTYDEAKRFAEAATMAYRRHHGVDATIMRIFNTYGPRMRPDDGRAIPSFIARALAGGPLVITGDGSQTRSMCYVDDLVDGALRLLFSTLSGPVNIGNPEEMTILELAERIRAATNPTVELSFVERPPDDPSIRRPDITLAREQLGWEPVVPLEVGLQATITSLADRLGVPVPATYEAAS